VAEGSEVNDSESSIDQAGERLTAGSKRWRGLTGRLRAEAALKLLPNVDQNQVEMGDSECFVLYQNT
jgi:hypothetical protein